MPPDRLLEDVIAVKLSKRGNDVYRKRLKCRLDPLFMQGENIVFFDKKDRDRRTNVLFITLEYDRNRHSIKDSWELTGKDFNRMATALRKAYGEVQFFRVWDSHATGMAHIQFMAIFFDHSFKVESNIKDNRLRWIIKGEDWGHIKGLWYQGYTDIEAVRTYQECMRYLEKRAGYGNDHADKDRGDLTLALTWLYRKRTFSVSGKLREFLSRYLKKRSDEITVMHNSNHHWRFLGVFKGSTLGLDGSIWFVELDRRIIDRLEGLITGYV
jgi:hypothetical protein